jgi:ABC-type dipeptide/oligopeptide/nickel transport system permease subunit
VISFLAERLPATALLAVADPVAAVLLAVVMSVNLLGDRLRDRMDVRGRDAAPIPL